MTLWPAATSRADIGAPIRPKPTNPMTGAELLTCLAFLEDAVGYAERLKGSGHPHVNRGLKKRLLYFGRGGAVDECATHVGTEFLRPVERRQHRQIEQAPGLPVEPIAAPDNAPAVLGHKL